MVRQAKSADSSASSVHLKPIEASRPGTQQFSRIWYRLPPDIRASFAEHQIEALQSAVAQEQPRTDIRDIRLSLRALRSNYFLRIIWGPEKRALRRLEAEGQVRLGPTVVIGLFAVWLTMTLAISVIAAVLYFAKSYVGLDLFPGPSIIARCFG
jgi:hypothetical protein